MNVYGFHWIQKSVTRLLYILSRLLYGIPFDSLDWSVAKRRPSLGCDLGANGMRGCCGIHDACMRSLLSYNLSGLWKDHIPNTGEWSTSMFLGGRARVWGWLSTNVAAARGRFAAPSFAVRAARPKSTGWVERPRRVASEEREAAPHFARHHPS